MDEAWVTAQFPDLQQVTRFAAGGQKHVFKAVHPTDGEVVIKLMKSAGASERAQREVLAVQKIKSPRVPPIFEHGVVKGPTGDDHIWIRERFIDGQDVRKLVQAGGMGRDEVMRLGLHVLEALRDAFNSRIIHRDIKPDNIIRGNDGSFWVIDFGLARHLDLPSLTATQLANGPGTVGYAPQEQFSNQKQALDSRADLFALAVTMVELISGQHPYRHGAKDVAEVFDRIVSNPMPIPALNWDVKDSVKDFITSMGQRRLDCRPQDPNEALSWILDVRKELGI